MLVLVGLVAVALNLRTAVTSLGVLLPEVARHWGMSGLLAGVLTALPVLVFGAVGALAPALVGLLGPERAVSLAMLAAAAGLAARAVAETVGLFVAATGCALAGAAVGNVLMPALVTRWFPARIGAATALCTTALAVGMAGGAALTGPAGALLDGGWRAGLGVWAALALAAVPPWLLIASRPPRRHPATTGPTGAAEAGVPPGGIAEPVPVWRVPSARALLVFFGCQSLNAYVVLGWLPSMLADAGWDPAAAGLPLALVGAMSVPMSILLPALAARRADQRGLVTLTTGSYALGYLALWAAVAVPPAAAGLGWAGAALLGAGNGAFPLAITLIGLRSRGADVIAALSGFVQGGGYLLAASGPVVIGLLHQLTDGWPVPLAAVLGTLVVQQLSGRRAARPGTVG
ncbi:MFS transporter [Pseudonocardia sp.]|uniref:MFS transporter n=1 Tax=Pseudonocardia sp. TaxID=60912 RepID=UPI003D0D56E7